MSRAALILLTASLVTSCAEHRPALTPEGLPDPSRRMLVKGWRLDPADPAKTAIFTFGYPAETSFFYSQSLSLKQRLHQYRLDAIETGRFPRLTVTDLDTRKPVVLTQDKEVNGLHIFSEMPLDQPAPAPAPVIEPASPPAAELAPVPAAPVPASAPAPIPVPPQ